MVLKVTGCTYQRKLRLWYNARVSAWSPPPFTFSNKI